MPSRESIRDSKVMQERLFTLLLFSPRAERKYPYLSAWKTSFCGLTSPYERKREKTERERKNKRKTNNPTISQHTENCVANSTNTRTVCN